MSNGMVSRGQPMHVLLSACDLARPRYTALQLPVQDWLRLRSHHFSSPPFDRFAGQCHPRPLQALKPGSLIIFVKETLFYIEPIARSVPANSSACSSRIPPTRLSSEGKVPVHRLHVI